MNIEIKKDLTSNWFKSLQNAICHSISDFENNKLKFETTLTSKVVQLTASIEKVRI